MTDILPIIRTRAPKEGKKGTEVTVAGPAADAAGSGPSRRHSLLPYSDAVVYPGGQNVELREVRPAGDGRLRILLRGAPRAALSPGALLLPPEAELFTSRWALFKGRCGAATVTVSSVQRVGGGSARIEPVVCRLRPLPDAKDVFTLEGEKAVPFLPGLRYELEAAGRAGCHSGLCLFGGPRPAGSRAGGGRATGRRLSEIATELSEASEDVPQAIERVLLSLYGVTPRLHGERGAPVGSGLTGFTHYVVTEDYLSLLGDMLEEAFSMADRLPVAGARDVAESDEAFVPRTLWRELLPVLEKRLGLRREGGMIVRSGATASRKPHPGGLSPAERTVLEEIRAAGTRGGHVKSQRLANARGVVAALLEQGLLVKLPNGKIYAREVLEEFAEVEGELDDRRGAEVWHVSRNTASQLIDLLVSEGLMHRTSPRSAARGAEQ